MLPCVCIRSKIRPRRLVGQGQHRIIIWTNLEGITSPILHTKSKSHRFSGSGENFKRGFDIYRPRGTGRRVYQYRQLREDKDYTLFSFSPRTEKQWNQLPSQTCLAESLDIFKTQVAKIEYSRPNLSNLFNLSKHFSCSFYLSISELPLVFPLSYTSLTQLFRHCLYYSSSCAPLVIRLKVAGIPVYRQKQKEDRGSI